MKVGSCRGSFKKWYFDVESQRCETFLYGGCNGNANRFDSKSQCQRECGRNFNGGVHKTTKTLLNGCLELGALLLQGHDVYGSKRSRKAKRRQIENEFQDLKCNL